MILGVYFHRAPRQQPDLTSGTNGGAMFGAIYCSMLVLPVEGTVQDIVEVGQVSRVTHVRVKEEIKPRNDE